MQMQGGRPAGHPASRPGRAHRLPLLWLRPLAAHLTPLASHPPTTHPQAHFNLQNVQGFSDVGVAHPTTLAPREARRFVQLAAARVVRTVTLAPGESWVGEMTLAAHDEYWPLPAWEISDAEGVPTPDAAPELLPGYRGRRAAAAAGLDAGDL